MKLFAYLHLAILFVSHWTFYVRSLPWVVFKSCYRGQREGKTEEYKITHTKNCHNNTSKQKEPAIWSKYIIITKETIYFNPHKNLPSRFIFLTTMSCSEAVLRAGCSVPASHKLVVVVLERKTTNKETKSRCARKQVPHFKCT